MRLSDILAQERLVLDTRGEIGGKAGALRRLAELVAPALQVDADQVERLLTERERLQSNGIGEGVAIPHARIDTAQGQVAALLLCPEGVPFDAIDGRDAQIIFGVVGPKGEPAAHLRVLARIARLLRDAGTRHELLRAPTEAAAYALIVERDREPR